MSLILAKGRDGKSKERKVHSRVLGNFHLENIPENILEKNAVLDGGEVFSICGEVKIVGSRD